jgi:hypothetical protein
MTENAEQVVNGIDLKGFQGKLLWLVGNYVRVGDLPTQESVNRLREIIKATIEVNSTGDNDARSFFTTKCLEVFHKPFDLYNDPVDRFGRRDIIAAELLQGLVEEKQKK